MSEGNDSQEPIRVSVVTPLIYVGVMLSAFIFFSIIYRRRKITHLAQVEPLFQENTPAEIYDYLKNQARNSDVEKSEKPHEKVLKAALLRRAAESIRRSLKLKENEPIFNKLYEEGLIGDDMFKQFEIAAKLQEIELKDIAQECESFKKGWSQQFFAVAQETCFNEALRRRLYAIDDREKDLAELWEYHVHKSEEEATDTNLKEQNKNSSSDFKEVEDSEQHINTSAASNKKKNKGKKK